MATSSTLYPSRPILHACRLRARNNGLAPGLTHAYCKTYTMDRSEFLQVTARSRGFSSYQMSLSLCHFVTPASAKATAAGCHSSGAARLVRKNSVRTWPQASERMPPVMGMRWLRRRSSRMWKTESMAPALGSRAP